jgi:hypothetical protein
MAVHIVAEWKDDTYSEYKKLNAQQIYDELRNLGKSLRLPFEQVPPQEAVDFARNNPQSEWYKVFEWNDSVAAEAYRRRQYGAVKGSIITFELKNPQVEVLDKKEKQMPIPLYINPRHKDVSNPVPTEIVMMEPDLRRSTLEQALKELNAFKAKYHFLKELSKVFEAINQVNIP